MANLGSAERPLRVAIIGSGPGGFYAASALFKQQLNIKVDMFDRLPAPFGLVRYGVAPDHPKIKNVIKVYEKEAQNPNFTFFGNVNVGEQISINELKQFYDAIVIATGAETDRKLGIEGEGLVGSHASTEFVGWYNGHPDFQDLTFDFSHEVAVVIGQGNVAMDVCRILLKTVDELKSSDITQNALEALASSKIKEVHCFGRRGPVQASFTPIEIREFGELADCNPVIDPSVLQVNEASLKELEDPVRKKNFEILTELSHINHDGKSRKFYLHFYKSPIEILGNGRVQSVVFEKNQLIGEPGAQKVRGTGVQEKINCGLVFRSIGYLGVPLKGLPFSSNYGVIPNQKGRITDSEQVFTGLYVAGWIKRGATGIIGTNKADSEETIHSLIEDIPHLIPCAQPSTQAVSEFLRSKEIRAVSFAEWKKIDAAEIE
ncbi:MAG: FAD-dependent oxidoreductase, partial [Candidatus Omnitrophica bacterium]|nr:FAD-dependent oxidoreductase [Candidatus Omnitrophota bacterium]